jgi:hypothetical protein
LCNHEKVFKMVELLVPEPSAFEIESSNYWKQEKLYFLTDQYSLHPSELMQLTGTRLCPEIHRIINSIENKKECFQLRKKYIILRCANL